MKTKRPLLAFLLILASALFVRSQGPTMIWTDGSGGGKIIGTGAYMTYKPIGTASLECIYDYTYLKDTLNPESAVWDVMRLQIGDKLSKFHSYKTFTADSLLRTETTGGNMPQNINRYAGGETYAIFKYREDGKLVYTDEIARDFFRYEEPAEPQQWEITGQTRDILGYECQRAVCNFRGRDYEAWFTPEIPLDQGPWKFCGLPGLIMAVRDTSGHHSFEMTGIMEVPQVPITIADARFHKATRKEFLRILYKYKADFVGYLSANSGINLKVTTADGREMDVAILDYDFLERDYK